VAGGNPAGHRRRISVIAYIVRRILVAILLMFIIIAVTFSIFFLVPRLAGASCRPREPVRRADRGRGADPRHRRAARLRRPAAGAVRRFVKQLFVGTDYNLGPTTEHCPAPCFGYSFVNQAPVWPDLLDRLPVTISLAAGAAVLWLLGGVSIGIISALRRGTVFDRASMGVALAGVSMPIFFTGLLLLTIFSYKLGLTAPGGSYTPIQVNPASWAYDLILPWVALAFLYAAGYARLTRAACWRR
jgi:ABC-type dipeptide/oligopeptide/nickel transport systems, permease components